MILSFAALAQQLLGAVDSGEGRLDLAADVPGFGAVAYWYEEQDHLRDRDWNQAAEEMVRCHGWLDGSQWMCGICDVFLWGKPWKLTLALFMDGFGL